ncbi:MAG: hypothetical protein GY839_18805 [candidate division Zixibacteria bacterium]|nr:hypothetical protein [candidate division Zixibacteria bacterium]
MPGIVFEYRKDKLEDKFKWMQHRIDETEGKGGFYLEGDEPKPNFDKDAFLKEAVSQYPLFIFSKETPLYDSVFNQTLIRIDEIDKDLLSYIYDTVVDLPKSYLDFLENKSILNLKPELESDIRQELSEVAAMDELIIQFNQYNQNQTITNLHNVINPEGPGTNQKETRTSEKKNQH